MTKIQSKNNQNHYTWGQGNDAWHFLDSSELSIIRECMHPGNSEQFHYHNKAEQYFFILDGIAEFHLNDVVYSLIADQGIHVPAKVIHKIVNNGPDELHFLVISRPKSHGDRVNL